MAFTNVAKQVYEVVKTPGELSPSQYQELIAAIAAFFTGVALIAEDKKQADDQLPVMRNSLTIISKLTNAKLPTLDDVDKKKEVRKVKKGAYEVPESISGGYEPVDAATIILPDVTGGVQHIKLGTDVAGLYNDLRQRYELIRADLASGHIVDDSMYVNMTGYTDKELDELKLNESEFVQHLWSQRSSATDQAQVAAEGIVKGKAATKLSHEFDTALEAVKHMVHVYDKAEYKLLSDIINTEFDRCDDIRDPTKARIKLDELSKLVTKIDSLTTKIYEHKGQREFLSNLNMNFTAKVVLKPLADHPITGLEKYYRKALHYKDMLVETEKKHVEYCQLLEKIVSMMDMFDIIWSDVALAFTTAIAMVVVCERDGLSSHKTMAESLLNRLRSKFTINESVYSDGLDVDQLIENLKL